ncbi:MAG: bifunctional riboflavin kinase/FAD synthetase [Deltaproteobacteria bacterium]|nr:bifunctional riboflavin kinase/FAD synthetase [Deltaproteobacteria bacterium]
MDILRNIEEITAALQGCIVTIGNYDGIHIGHQEILRRVATEAQNQNRKSVVITFEPHPQKVIHPERRPFYLLTPLEEKLGFLESLGINTTIVITFTPEFAEITAEQFVHTILGDKLRIKKIFIGYDYAFGKNKAGNAEYLREAGARLGFEVEEIGPVKMEGIIVSSTNIRLALLDGKIKRAAKMLDRSYNVSGTVVKGHRRGTTIGFPTANIKSDKVIPGVGVYVIIAEIEGTKHQGVLNIGFNPTFGNDELSIEVHLLDFHGDIYGKFINIHFIERLRDEKKFESPEKLVEQIGHDIERAKAILAPYVM